MHCELRDFTADLKLAQQAKVNWNEITLKVSLAKFKSGEAFDFSEAFDHSPYVHFVPALLISRAFP